MTRFVVYRDIAGQYRWRLIARNGEIVATSEAYTTKYNALNSANRVKIWAKFASIVDLTAVR